MISNLLSPFLAMDEGQKIELQLFFLSNQKPSSQKLA